MLLIYGRRCSALVLNVPRQISRFVHLAFCNPQPPTPNPQPPSQQQTVKRNPCITRLEAYVQPNWTTPERLSSLNLMFVALGDGSEDYDVKQPSGQFTLRASTVRHRTSAFCRLQKPCMKHSTRKGKCRFRPDFASSAFCVTGTHQWRRFGSTTCTCTVRLQTPRVIFQCEALTLVNFL